MDENVDYDERESEFDLEDEDKSVQMNEEEKAEIIDEVDVDKNLPIPAFCSSVSVLDNFCYAFKSLLIERSLFNRTRKKKTRVHYCTCL